MGSTRRMPASIGRRIPITLILYSGVRKEGGSQGRTVNIFTNPIITFIIIIILNQSLCIPISHVRPFHPFRRGRSTPAKTQSRCRLRKTSLALHRTPWP